MFYFDSFQDPPITSYTFIVMMMMIIIASPLGSLYFGNLSISYIYRKFMLKTKENSIIWKLAGNINDIHKSWTGIQMNFWPLVHHWPSYNMTPLLLWIISNVSLYCHSPTQPQLKSSWE
jgi:hypothetical protein